MQVVQLRGKVARGGAFPAGCRAFLAKAGEFMLRLRDPVPKMSSGWSIRPAVSS